MNSNTPSSEAVQIQCIQSDCVSELPSEDSPKRPPWSCLKLGIVCLLVWIFSTFYLISQVPYTTFNGDESGWINYGMSSAELLMTGNFSGEAWEFESLYGEINMTLGKMIIGLPLSLYAKSEDIPPFKRLFDFDKNYEQNVILGNVPHPELLLLARKIHAMVGGLVCALLFFLAYSISGWGAATVTLVLLISNRAFLLIATEAMTDMPYNLFLLMGVTAMLFFVESNTKRGRLGLAGICGIAGGLASCVKFIGLPLLGLFFTLVLFLSWKIGRDSIRASIGYLSITAICGMSVVYLLTPNYWPRFDNFDASALSVELYELVIEGKKVPMHDGTTKKIMEIVSSVNFQRKEIRQTYPQISNILLPPVEFFFLPMRWDELYDNFQAWAHVGLPSVRDILRDNFITYRSFRVESLLLIGSIFYCLYLTWKGVNEKFFRQESVILICFLGYTAFLLFTMRMNAERYYLPSIMTSDLLCGIGVSALMRYRKPF